MAQVYHINKEQLSRLYTRMNARRIYLEDIKSYLDPKSIKEHSDIIPAGVYVADSEGAEGGLLASYILRYKGTIDDTRPIYGNVIFQYGKATYARLPDHLKLTDAQVDAIRFNWD
jgi:hypothetical protein